jgi:glucose-1-phosphate adenylyltransferase
MSDETSGRFVSRLTRDTLALILAGGKGSRLHDLTNWRAKPAVPFGGKYRIIDFPLSNCVNSGVRRVGILTQYKAHSLIRHVQQGWGFLSGNFDEFVELIPAQQRTQSSWYQGTADAILQNLDIIRRHDPAYVLILAGDHIYKMDYGTMLAAHVERGADITVGCIEVDVEEASAFGVMAVDADMGIVEFEEKPERPQEIPGKPGRALASMGIYVFSTEVLYEELTREVHSATFSHDFGRDIIPSAINERKVCAFPFRDAQHDDDEAGTKQAFWRDVGTIDAFWEANMELIGISPELNLYDSEWPIWTYQQQVPPAKFIFDDDGRRGMAVDSMVSGGCIVSGSIVRHSLLFTKVRVHSFCEIEDSVVFPGVDIARRCKIRRAVIDRGCNIPEGMQIGYDEEEDRKRFHVTAKGIVLVTPEMLGEEFHHVV